MDTITSEAKGIAESKPGKYKHKSRVKKVLLASILSLIVIGVAAQVVYTYSGSGQWIGLGEKNGVTVYSMKSPGSNLNKFRAVWRVRSTLSRFAMFAQDADSDLGIGYYDVKEIGRDGERTVWSAWKQKFPSPYKPREFVTRNELSQNANNKELLFKVTATPDKLPPNKCCFRVAVMNNSWRLTPVGNGNVEIEWTVDMDMGLPYFMINAKMADWMRDFAGKMQGYLDRDKYNNAKYDWIQEVTSRTSARENSITHIDTVASE